MSVAQIVAKPLTADASGKRGELREFGKTGERASFDPTEPEFAQAPFSADGLLGRPVISTGYLPVVGWISRGVRSREPIRGSKHESEIGVRWRLIVLADPCPYCGQNLSETVDHIKARSKGGHGKWFNLAGACDVCNRAKGNMSLLDFVRHREALTARMSAGPRSVRNKLRNRLDKHLAKLGADKANRYDLLRERMAEALRG